MIYFGFAVADSMFPEECSAHRKPMTKEAVQAILAGGDVGMCLNPAHEVTVGAAIKFGLNISIPEKAPKVTLKPGDQVIVMSIRGLPRMEEKREYTQEEVDRATFVFGIWTLLEDAKASDEPCGVCFGLCPCATCGNAISSK